MNDRYVYLLETKIYTYRSYFNLQSPTASELMKNLLGFHAKKLIGKYSYGKTTVSLDKMRIVDGNAELLFRATNPDIPDNRYFSAQNDELRDAPRKGDEEPAISCHVIIDLDSKHDNFKAYPTAIENVPYISRSIILYTLNNIFSDHLREDRQWTPSKGDPEDRPFIPKVMHQAPADETIGGLLDAKGTLKGIEIVDETLKDGAAFDGAVPHSEKRSVQIIPEKASTPKIMKEFVVSRIKGVDLKKVRKVTVTIEDPNHGKEKVISIDKTRANILDNAFIPQKLISKIKPSLLICEDDFHTDLASKMRALL